MLRTILIAIIVLASIAVGQNFKTLENSQKFGQSISSKDTILVSALMNNPEKFIGKDVLVKGMITNVCKKRGCWMDLASDKEFQKVTIKVNDGEIVFPIEAKGKTAIAQGKFEVIELSKEQALKYLQHQADEQGKTFDPKSVTAPIKIYRIKGSGAEIEN